MIPLKQSTAVNVMLGPFVDSTDGVTTEESLTLAQADLQISKNGGAAAQKNNVTSATHIYGGNYSVPLDTTDTGTLGSLRLMCKKSGALPVVKDFMVLPANVYDSLYAGSDYLQVDAMQVEGSDATDQINAACDTAISDAALATASALNTHDGKLDTVDSNVDAILLDTAEIGTAGAGLSAIPWNAAWDTEVQSECTDALNAYDPPTKSEMDAGFAGLNDLSAAEVNAEVDNALNTAIPGSPTADSINERIAALDDLLQSGGSGDAAAILADTNELQGNQGNWVTATGFSTHSAADVRAEMDSNSTQLAAIIEDTGTTLDGKLNTIDTVVDAIKLKTDNLPADPADQSDVEAKIDTLNNISAADVWAEASALSGLDFSDLVERVYQVLANKETITDATGAVALRNMGDSADLATWTITDDDTVTTRTEASWT